MTDERKVGSERGEQASILPYLAGHRMGMADGYASALNLLAERLVVADDGMLAVAAAARRRCQWPRLCELLEKETRRLLGW